MCGITGSLALRSGDSIEPSVLESMTDTLIHRGPDAVGAYRRDGLAFGFRRLSFVDLAHGDQPMVGETGDVVMVCNGEVFNHKELRAELETRGHTFRTRCDVEVILHLYEEVGVRLLDRLNGQFAFAVYDARTRELVLARDHAGIVPLYYANTGSHLVFGSEVKAILPHPGVPREVDLAGLDQVLTFPGLVSPQTMFRGIKSLPGGHYLRVRDGHATEHRYWDLDYPVAEETAQQDKPDEYYIQTLRELLTAAVRKRLEADVPVGFYLSGGLDSSLIAGLTSAAVGPAHSFSVTFPDSPIDESVYQRLMAVKAGSIHHEAPFTPDDVVAELRRMVWHAEMPVRETYNTCSMVLSALAREHGVKAILTGEGADELFGGYIGYRFDQLGRGAGSTGNGLTDAFEDDMRTKLWGDPSLFYERQYYTWRETKMDLYSADVRANFTDVDCLRAPVVDPAMLAGRERLSQRSYLDFKLRLSDHLLSDHGDRVALANSVEARYPFLDRDVVEFARTVPSRLKVHETGEKYLIKQAAAGVVPPEIIQREKYGFRAQGSPQLLRGNVEWINDLLSPALIKRQGYFDPVVVEHLRKRYLRPDFELHPHLDDDLLLVVLTFGILLDTFGLPGHT